MPNTDTVSQNPLDTQSRDFAEECCRQSRLIAQDPQEGDMLDWIEQVADRAGWGVVKE